MVGFRQVLGEEEKIAQDEFSKFEQRLHQNQHKAEKRDSE
jgi:transposase